MYKRQLKTLDAFDWGWPKKINRPQIQNLFHLRFIEDRANVIFISNVGLGKSHFSIALGHTACLRGYSVLFTTAVDIINSLSAAQAHGNLKRELHKYLQPRLLIVDEIGYLPIDKHGADPVSYTHLDVYKRQTDQVLALDVPQPVAARELDAEAIRLRIGQLRAALGRAP